jgi:hypothetical protein
MNYDTWKAHNPADEFLGPEPEEEVRVTPLLTTVLGRRVARHRQAWGDYRDECERSDSTADSIRAAREEWTCAAASLAWEVDANLELIADALAQREAA